MLYKGILYNNLLRMLRRLSQVTIKMLIIKLTCLTNVSVDLGLTMLKTIAPQVYIT